MSDAIYRELVIRQKEAEIIRDRAFLAEQTLQSDLLCARAAAALAWKIKAQSKKVRR